MMSSMMMCFTAMAVYILIPNKEIGFEVLQPLYIVFGFEFGLVAAAASSWCVVFVATIPEEIVCFWFCSIVVSDPSWCCYHLWSNSSFVMCLVVWILSFSLSGWSFPLFLLALVFGASEQKLCRNSSCSMA
ncbi:hypothetical protein U1Q18_003069 [Sarracenia purpurea var. burkii]